MTHPPAKKLPRIGPEINTSYKIVEMVRQKISSPYVTASDTAVAKVLGVSRQAVSAYKAGRDVMSTSTLAQVNQVLQLELDQLGWLAIELKGDRAINHVERQMWEDIRQRLCAATRVVPSILLVALGLMTAHGKAVAAMSDVELVGDCQIANLYIMRNSMQSN